MNMKEPVSYDMGSFFLIVLHTQTWLGIDDNEEQSVNDLRHPATAGGLD
ncbi:hypothetical protein ACIQW7_09725 [Peribacillus simplex]